MTTGRVAGKALGDFFKVLGGAVSSGVEKNVLTRLAGSTEFVDAPGITGKIAGAASRNPEIIAKLAGASVPVIATGAAMAGAAGASRIGRFISPEQNVYAQSQYSLPVGNPASQVSYANQQYYPGVSPMTNAAAAESLLEQQKFQHQLQLIQARQSVQQGTGNLAHSGAPGLNVMGLSKQIFSPVSY